ncbi:hypothetical protein D9611_011762 [Ephemerocybe angulata]|uniref:NAD(P)-binding protein n=1 Tax=Ephemerocybe angulata TaxID=980116 RepID=A0A8H5C4W7_9AGAR|nr:hypothetical protein D9611_011762 [Tulosesus angulatus]
MRNEKDDAPVVGDAKKPRDISEAYEVMHTPSIFSSARRIPTLDYTLQNIFMSLATLVVATASLILTSAVILPLSLLRSVLPKQMLMQKGADVVEAKGKVVLIVGASRGIGMEVLKTYVPEPGTTVIAVSKNTAPHNFKYRSLPSNLILMYDNADFLRNALITLGDTPATLQMATIDLSANHKEIARAITELDKTYGPITHLYAIAGISNHLKDSSPWGLVRITLSKRNPTRELTGFFEMQDVTEKMIQVNVSGITAVAMSMYECMKERQYGKICIVGSVAGIYAPSNMISYASTKSFLNTFSTSLRTLAAAYNVDVVTIQPGFIDTRMTKKMRGQGSTLMSSEFNSAEEIAKRMKSAVEKGGVGVMTWPTRQSVMMYGFKGLNPICDELGRYISMKGGMGGKKIT